MTRELNLPSLVRPPARETMVRVPLNEPLPSSDGSISGIFRSSRTFVDKFELELDNGIVIELPGRFAPFVRKLEIGGKLAMLRVSGPGRSDFEEVEIEALMR